MSVWNKVRTGFNPLDETLVFGPRTCVESDGNIYESTTQATISTDLELGGLPKILASVHSSSILCVAVDKNLIVFSINDSALSCSLNIEFSSTVDCFTLSHDGAFLFVCIRNVGVECYSIQEKIHVFKRELNTENEEISFVHISLVERDETYEVLAVGSNGNVYRLLVRNLKKVTETSETEKTESENSYELICETFPRPEELQSVVLSATTFNENTDVEHILFGNCIHRCRNGELIDFVSVDEVITKIQQLQQSRYILGLTASKKLIAICQYSLQLCILNEEKLVEDFVVLESGFGGNDTVILMLEKNIDVKEEESQIHVSLFPSFEIKYSIKVPYISYLANITCSTQELFYIEGSSSKKNTSIDTLSVKILAQGIPQFRLDHLIRRGLFADAQQFAIVYGLDVEAVYKSHAVHIAQQNTCNVDTLLGVLSDITDIQFVAECCSKATTRNLNETRELLEYSLNRLENMRNQTGSANVEKLLAEVNSTLLRLDTFEILHQCDSVNVDDWIAFSKADLFGKCSAYLSQGDIMKAAILWNRYITSFKKRLSPPIVVDVLQSLPDHMPIQKMAPFLQFFIPHVLQTCPQAWDEIIDWAFDKVKKFELKKSLWPGNALCFLQDLSNLMNEHQNNKSSSAAISRMHHMIRNLKDLEELWKTYHIHLKLNDYLQEDKQKVTECILNEATVDNLKPLIDSFLKQFFSKNNMSADYVLLHYVNNIINNSFCYYIVSSWEFTVPVISACIDNIEDRIECILLALKKASVPWCPAIAKMAEVGARLKHTKAAEIRSEQINVRSKLILKKYGVIKHIQQGAVHVHNSLDHIRYVIKQERKELHDDVMQLSESSQQLCIQALMLLAEFYMGKGQHSEAFSVLGKLDGELLEEFCLKIVYKVDCLLKTDFLNDECSNYITALGHVVHKFGKLFAELQDLPVQPLKNIFTIKCEFGKSLTLNQYMSKKFCRNFLKEYVLQMLENETASYDCMKNDVQRLAHLLQFTYEEGLMELGKQACFQDKLDVSCEVFRCVTDMPCYLKLTSNDLFFTVKTLITSEKKQGMEELGLVEKLSGNACCYCGTDGLIKWLDLFQWSGIIQQNKDEFRTADEIHSTNYNEFHYNIFESIYVNHSLFSQHTLLRKLIAETFLIFDNTNIQDLDAEAKAVFMCYSQHLGEDLCEMAMLKVLMNLYCRLLNGLSSNKYNSELDIFSVTQKVLHKILKVHKPDKYLGIAILCTDEATTLQELTVASKMYHNDCLRLGSLSELAVAYSKITMNSDLNTQFFASLLRCKWIKKLVKFKIPYKEAHKQFNSDTLDIFKVLITIGNLPVQVIEEFCIDFALDLEDYLFLYLETLILSWKPEIIVTTNSDGRKEFTIKNSEETVLKKGQEIVEKIISKGRVLQCMQDLYYKISYYHYEMYICVNQLLGTQICLSQNEEEFNLLVFLKSYQRIGLPNQKEVELWFDRYPDACEFPAIAEFRLPFLPLKENPLWTVKTELNLKTYRSWLPIAKILQLDEETVCTIAAKNSITEEFSEKWERNSNSWCLTEHHSSFLKEIMQCLEYCKDMEKACAVLYYATNHMPPGADQVVAAEMCYKLALQWVGQPSLGNSAKQCIRKVQHKYLQLRTAHILHKHGLGNDSALFNLSPKPQQLISALFQHQAITSNSTRHCPDINGAVEELAKLFNINSLNLRKEKLEEVLTPDITIEAELLESTMTDGFQQPSHQTFRNIDEESLLRASYILQVDKNDILVCCLVNTVIGDNSDAVRACKKLRALQCLLSTVPVPTLENYFRRDEVYIRSLAKNLGYISKLEALGMRYTLCSFESCNKVDVVSHVWRQCSDKPLALILVSDLLLEYKIYDLNWWDPLLKAMVKFQMMSELEEYLPQLIEHCHILGCSGLILAWNYITVEPFTAGDFPLTVEQNKQRFQCLIKLQACPIINNINFGKILDHCLRTKSLHMAAAILPLLRNRREGFAQIILDNSDPATLKENLNQLESQGILTAPQAIKILGL